MMDGGWCMEMNPMCVKFASDLFSVRVPMRWLWSHACLRWLARAGFYSSQRPRSQQIELIIEKDVSSMPNCQI
jgi:hypothetical protein